MRLPRWRRSKRNKATLEADNPAQSISSRDSVLKLISTEQGHFSSDADLATQGSGGETRSRVKSEPQLVIAETVEASSKKQKHAMHIRKRQRRRQVVSTEKAARRRRSSVGTNNNNINNNNTTTNNNYNNSNNNNNTNNKPTTTQTTTDETKPTTIKPTTSIPQDTAALVLSSVTSIFATVASGVSDLVTNLDLGKHNRLANEEDDVPPRRSSGTNIQATAIAAAATKRNSTGTRYGRPYPGAETRIVQEMWENQRWMPPVQSWSHVTLPGERGPYSDRIGSVRFGGIEDIPVTPCWVVEVPWQVDQWNLLSDRTDEDEPSQDTGIQVDAEGWMYQTVFRALDSDFSRGKTCGHSKRNYYVRRRRWTRVCVLPLPEPQLRALTNPRGKRTSQQRRKSTLDSIMSNAVFTRALDDISRRMSLADGVGVTENLTRSSSTDTLATKLSVSDSTEFRWSVDGRPERKSTAGFQMTSGDPVSSVYPHLPTSVLREAWVGCRIVGGRSERWGSRMMALVEATVPSRPRTGSKGVSNEHGFCLIRFRRSFKRYDAVGRRNQRWWNALDNKHAQRFWLSEGFMVDDTVATAAQPGLFVVYPTGLHLVNGGATEPLHTNSNEFKAVPKRNNHSSSSNNSSKSTMSSLTTFRTRAHSLSRHSVPRHSNSTAHDGPDNMSVASADSGTSSVVRRVGNGSISSSNGSVSRSNGSIVGDGGAMDKSDVWVFNATSAQERVEWVRALNFVQRKMGGHRHSAVLGGKDARKWATPTGIKYVATPVAPKIKRSSILEMLY